MKRALNHSDNKRKGDTNMTTTFKARFTNGVIEPLEKIDLPEGSEFTINVTEEVLKTDRKELKEDILDATFGAWADMDCETLKKNIYADREISSRIEVKL
jgi:predicted DNA-binding antitoxin AbrB/MazE fold protein